MDESGYNAVQGRGGGDTPLNSAEDSHIRDVRGEESTKREGKRKGREGGRRGRRRRRLRRRAA